MKVLSKEYSNNFDEINPMNCGIPVEEVTVEVETDSGEIMYPYASLADSFLFQIQSGVH